jgi:hypothetical protein
MTWEVTWTWIIAVSPGNPNVPGDSVMNRPCDRFAVRGMAIDRGQ